MKPSIPSFPAACADVARTSLVALLCLTTAVPQAFGAVSADGSPSAIRTAPLSSEQKSLHALNRLTFGPRPGEVAEVNAQGLDRWLDQQLHPERIDDAAFERRMGEFPAMQLSTAELLQRFPGPQELRRMQQRGLTAADVTNDPAERAIYADAMARYKVTKKLIAAGQTPGAAQAASANAEMVNADRPAMKGDSDMAGGNGDTAMSEGQADGKNTEAKANPAREEVQRVLRESKLSREDIEAIIALAPQQRFERVLSLAPADAFKFGAFAQRQPGEVMAGLTPSQREVLQALGNPARVVATETLETRLLRDVYSRRQVQAVMTDFWLNHFSVYVRKNQLEPYLLNSYERDVVLPNSLGNFEELLVATAKSPAMLMYLDNWQSIGPDSVAAQRVAKFKKLRPNAPLAKAAPQGINENYARELMELHTVGVNGGYTQKDVIEVAKCFTGWTIDRPYAGGGGQFRFDPARHEGGSKTVLGVTIPEGGMQEGLTVLHMLATNPRTAHFVSQKLAVRFVSDTPPAALVDRMAATFLKSNGDIKAVLSTMFHAPEFWSPEAYRAKVKTPVEFLVSALRASDAEISNPGLLVVAADRLGMPIYGMQTPNGYSWQSSDWVSTGGLVNRMNFALLLSGEHVRGVTAQWPHALDDASESNAEKQLETLVLGEAASAHTRATVLDQFRNPAVQQEAQKGFALNAAIDEEGNPMEAQTAEQANTPQGNMDGKMRKTAIAARNKGPAGYFRAQAGGFNLNADQPSTPLQTMVGLLLGSPDFQRR